MHLKMQAGETLDLWDVYNNDKGTINNHAKLIPDLFLNYALINGDDRYKKVFYSTVPPEHVTFFY